MENYNNILNNARKIHFIGIGGSGMCPLAEIMQSKGFEISGSDNYESDTLKGLIGQGAEIYKNHCAENIK